MARKSELGRRLCAALGVVPVELGRDGLDARIEIRLPASNAAGGSDAVAFSSYFTSFEDCWDDLLFGDWSLAYQVGVWRSRLRLLRRRGLAGGRWDEFREACERKGVRVPRFSSAEELELWLVAKGA